MEKRPSGVPDTKPREIALLNPPLSHASRKRNGKLRLFPKSNERTGQLLAQKRRCAAWNFKTKRTMMSEMKPKQAQTQQGPEPMDTVEVYAALEQRVEDLEAQVRVLMRAIGSQGPASTKKDTHPRDLSVVSALGKMTPKMHLALQMVIAGRSNRDIADEHSVTESTAKAYVRSVAQKLGVTTRAEIVTRVLPTLRSMSDAEYEAISGGVKKCELAKS